MKDLLGLAHQYAFPELEQSISEYLKSILSLGNVCLVYDVANLYQLRSLTDACRQFADRQAADILQSDAFLQLSPVKNTFNLLSFFLCHDRQLFSLFRVLSAIYCKEIRSALPKWRFFVLSSVGGNTTATLVKTFLPLWATLRTS